MAHKDDKERGLFCLYVIFKRNPADVMYDDICLKKIRTDVERVAAQDYRARAPSNQDDGDKLLDDGKIQVWDLKEELAEID